MSESDHQDITLMAKRSGQTLNQFIVRKATTKDELKIAIDTIKEHQNRAFDSLLIQISEQNSTSNDTQNINQNSLSASEFREFNRRLLTIFSIVLNKQNLSELQPKVNLLADDLIAGTCNKTK